MSKKIGMFCGSFDPFHKGHKYVVDTALKIFDEVVICVASNPSKKYLFGLKERLDAIKTIFNDNNRVRIIATDGLVADAAKAYGASFIIKGVRNSKDFDDEIAQSDANKFISDLQTIFIPTPNDLSFVSSTLVRTLIGEGERHKLELKKILCEN